MSQIISILIDELGKVEASIKTSIPSNEPLSVAHGNWSFPGLTSGDLIRRVQKTSAYLAEFLETSVEIVEKELQDYPRRLQFLVSSTIPNIWGNAAVGIPALLHTLDGLIEILEPLRTKDDGAQAVKALKLLQTRIRAMESRFRDLEPRTDLMEDMIGRIENANEAADRLPETLESLTEYQIKLSSIEHASTKDYAAIENLKALAEADRKQFVTIKSDADSVLKRCETAYSAATSVGLAAAFTERSESLTKTITTWVFCLAGALALACGLGIYRIIELSEVIKTASPATYALNVLVSALAVGGPVWFAWLSTKQIGQRFRLSEDYAFKASVSRAYEGYSREAARIDKDLEARLLASAISRLDELPLRVLDHSTHGSPLHELASSDLVAQAMKSVPGFAGEVKALAARAVGAVETATAAAVARVPRKNGAASKQTNDE